MLKMYSGYLKAFLGNKKGQGMVEYGLIIGLIAVVVIVVLGTMGGQIKTLFQTVSDKLVPPAGA